MRIEKYHPGNTLTSSEIACTPITIDAPIVVRVGNKNHSVVASDLVYKNGKYYVLLIAEHE